MYFYIFDPVAPKEISNFERVQGKLSNLLAENRIEGETYRVTSIRTIELLVDQALGLDARTLIVVGSDASLNKAVNACVRKQAEITIGYIPLDSQSSLAHIFGISDDIEEAVKILAGRLVQELNLGKVGEHYFLSQVDLGEYDFRRREPGFWGLSAMRRFLDLEPFPLMMALENSYNATSEVIGAQVINCRSNVGCKRKLGDPTDKLLDVVLLNKLKSSQIFRYRRELASGCLDNVPGATIMHAKKIEILGPRKLPLMIAGQVLTKAPAVITVAKESVKMIVGKGRQF